MKKLFLVIFVYLFSQVSSLANERDTRLNQLFNELKVNKSKVAFIIEQEIWTLWSTHPTDEKLTARLEEGSQFVRNQNYLKAKDIFLIQAFDKERNYSESAVYTRKTGELIHEITTNIKQQEKEKDISFYSCKNNKKDT